MSIEGEALRAMMRRVPAPVTVVTASDGREARGVTIGSFTSVSLDPPLVSFNLMRVARMHVVMEGAPYFAVHLLSEDQAALSHHFALPEKESAEQFDGIPVEMDGRGVPILSGTLGVILCRPYAVYEAGDHSIFVGEVLEVRDGVPGSPLVYFNRSYRVLGDALPVG